MPLPAGWTLVIQSVELDFRGDAAVRWQLTNARGAPCGHGTYTAQQVPARTGDRFAEGGTEFVTWHPVSRLASLQVSVGERMLESGYNTVEQPDGRVRVTLAQGTQAVVALGYEISPHMQVVGDIPATLGLQPAALTGYAGGAGSSAHRHVNEVAALLHAWARARLMEDLFGGA